MSAARGYSVEETEFGILVTGAGIPIEDFLSLCKVWEKRGLTELLPGVAKALDALFAVSSKVNAPRWIQAVTDGAALRSRGDREVAWLTGPDTGTSSLTIFSALSRGHAQKAATRRGHPSLPWDPEDFGRCHRLLKVIPEWRSRLGEVAAKHPEWTALVREWDELERLYEEELPTGHAPKLYARMKALIAEVPR